APIEIAHPALFVPKLDIAAKAAQRKVQADEAAGKASQARLAAVAASREAARATMALRAAVTVKTRADAQLAAAQAALASTKSPDKEELAKDAVAKATARLEELETKLNAAKADLQPKLDAVGPLREAAASAAAASAAAAQEARELSRALEPVSVFISRKTQRLYVRRAFAPILEIPVTIQDPERPIGTHVFTAVEQANGGMRWSVISVNDAGDAKSALDRIAFPQDASFDRIAGTAQLRSSVIISDEELSSETGKGTDFVVLLGGEPQGGIARRRSYAPAEAWYQGPRYRYRLPFWR
ncbi:MAG: L,D-transpeptidase, partial [Xanthobacteraceae bacterium]